MMEGFERHLTPEQQTDPRYALRAFMILKTANRGPSSDLAVEIVPPGSDVAAKFNIALKEVEKKKYLPSDIVRIIQEEGWNRFTMDSHTKLWQRVNAKDPEKAFGAVAVGKVWFWYDNWLERVRLECRENPDRYRAG